MKKEVEFKKINLEFSCLCLDINNECSFGLELRRFFDTLKSNVSLFEKELRDEKIEGDLLIAHSDNKKIAIRKLSNPLGNLDYRVGFYVVINFKYEESLLEEIDSFRTNLIKYLVDLKFGKIFVLKDELSSHLLNQLYASLNRVENLLRAYIIKKFTVTEGAGYVSSQIFDSEQKNKTNKRKYNENIFSSLTPNGKEGLIDSKIYLLDFEDLGSIIYSSSFGNLKVDDVVFKINNSSSLDELKNDAKSYIDKYFKKFIDINFGEKWNFLKNIRHKIAHNGLTNLEEISKAEVYLEELSSFLEKENEEIIETPEISRFQDIEKNNYILEVGLREISKNEILGELSRYKVWSESLGREFFGLKNFLHNIIGGKGYRIGGAWDILEELERDGYIKINEWVDPSGRFPKQKEIVFLKNLPVYSS